METKEMSATLSKSWSVVLLGAVVVAALVGALWIAGEPGKNSVGESADVESAARFSAARAFGVIQSAYLTDEDFQTYIQKVLADLVAIEREDIVAESVAVVEQTQQAIDALSWENKSAAKNALEKALGKLEAVLAIEPKASHVPVDASAEIQSLLTEKETVQATKAQAAQAVAAGDIQRARLLLANLRNEITLQTVTIPLASHGIALREALRLTDAEKYSEARELLRIALNTLVIVERHIPIPLLNAELLVGKSSEAVESDPQKALAMLGEARTQIEIAELLGYGFVAGTDYRKLYAELVALENKVKGTQDSDQAYKDLEKTIEDLRVKISQ